VPGTLRPSGARRNRPYNFVRRHMTLETTPPIAARVAEREWTMAESPSKARRPLHPPSKEA